MVIYERILPTQIAEEQGSKDSAVPLLHGIPVPMYKTVWEENAQFLRDRQLFDSTYFDFMFNFCKLFQFDPGSRKSNAMIFFLISNLLQ